LSKRRARSLAFSPFRYTIKGGEGGKNGGDLERENSTVKRRDSGGGPGPANHLKGEKSPYLIQHMYNPVDWYPWGEEAREKARRENKPMLVSIGYSTCHWCHVMESESFEDPATARVMNERFVSVKVDREERPEVDSLYMKAVQALTGRGGWPLNVFTTPEGVPFYGGTYFPPKDMHGLPAFTSVLLAVSEAYDKNRDHVERVTSEVTSAIERLNAAGRVDPGPGVAEKAVDAARMYFDPVNGGFGLSTKFPHAMFLRFLLKHHGRTGSGDALHIVEASLRSMALGGIYDHVGGGFHRYSVDERWDVPHFEKMLYDNALLLGLYSEAFRATGTPLYGEVAAETASYLLREMRDPGGGGFFAAQDADSEGREGAYYLWTPDQVRDAVGGEEAARVIEYFSMTEAGNYEGGNTLRVSRAAREAPGGTDPAIKGLKARLLDARSKRVPPATDRKVITAWNGLAATALVSASAALDRPDLLEEAARCVDFVLAESRDESGRLLRYWLDGRSGACANLEDYALVGSALMALYEAGDRGRLDQAAALAEDLARLFAVEGEPLFSDTGIDGESLFMRDRDLHDNDLPSGNSAAAGLLLRLGRARGEGKDGRFTALALGVLSSVEGIVEDPLAYGHMLCVLEDYLASGS